MFMKLKRILLGDPLATHREKHERLSIPLGLAVFASDALSSTAYATDEILLALSAASAVAASANLLSLPVAAAIVVLMIIVVASYVQLIKCYPEGGGTYTVAKEMLGPMASQTAGAALMIDYILTVAVSVSAGISYIVSSGWLPIEYKTLAAIFLVMCIMYVNLRGIRESGKVVAVPAYVFIGAMLVLVAVGLFQWTSGQVHPPTSTLSDPANNPPDWTSMAMILLFLNAFSHGCAALTGIEAISNGVKAFREPAHVNANKTLVMMALVLGFIFLGVTTLGFIFHIQPDHSGNDPVISKLSEAVFGEKSWYFYLVNIITACILLLAANTSFAGFPRLASILANDGFLPRQLTSLGDKLVFSNGILILGTLSILLIWGFQADTHALIPLYAVGVFLSFTMAQWGMVIHHRKIQEPQWKRGMLINGFGAVVTGIVTCILIFEKFTEGAWIVMVAAPFIIYVFRRIKAHYVSVGKQLALPETGYCPTPIEHTVLVLVSSLNRGTIPALEYAKTISKTVEAVHVELNLEATERLKKAWDEWGCGIPLTILKSPYRSLTQPILDYVDEVEKRHERDLVTVIVPEFVTRRGWHNFLHNQTALLLKAMLRNKKDKIVTTVRYHLSE